MTESSNIVEGPDHGEGNGYHHPDNRLGKTINRSHSLPTHYVASRILKEPNFEIRPLGRGFPHRPQYVFGFDTEAENGEPFLLQIAHPDSSVYLLDVTPESILNTFLRHIDENTHDQKFSYTVFGFNLAYEYTQLFQALPSTSWGFGEIEYDGGWFKLYVYNEKRFTFLIQFPGKKTIRVLDAMAFLPTSLANASLVTEIGEKYEKPPTFTRSQRFNADFIRYSEQDAILTQKLGDYIVDLHRNQDVPLSLSASHFAAQVFRRKYLHDSVPRPSEELEQLGLECYHGGKNAYYVDHPSEYEIANAYDIRSAYSEAMAGLPDIETGIWEPTREIYPHSILRVKGKYQGCKYQPLWGLGTQYIEEIDIATTGYELISAIHCGCIEVKQIKGYRLVGNSHGSLWQYVKDFYDMKRYATTSPEKIAAKLFLNGLYGKFFQKVPIGKAATFNLENGQFQIHDWDQPYDYIAGGLYHPPIASLITGFVRAKIHNLEHRYRAIMTSTDGIFATQKPLQSDIGEELGQLEHQEGNLRVWRERLYIFQPSDGTKSKMAFHGFRGKEAELSQIPLEKGKFAYDAIRATTLRMAISGKYRPGQFVEAEYHVKL